ncbi:MAG: neutral zinc metallopeptidase, partial [Actinomycetota bacterium]|nr:neutral zinc metallopeptidase [Actinomycetota bacterium]
GPDQQPYRGPAQQPPYAGPGQQPYRGPAQQPPYAGPGQQPPAYPQSPYTEQRPAQHSPPPAGPPAPASYPPQGQHYYAPGQYNPGQYNPGQYNPGQYTPGQYTPHPHQQYTPDAPRPAPYGYAQPQWGYGGWAPPPPPRRRSGGRLALGMVGVSAVVFFALIVLSAVIGSSPGSRSDVAVDHSPARASNPNTEPVDASDATAVLERNTLYQQGGLANGACPAQDLGTASTEDQTRFYEALITCLNDEWQPIVESAGYDYADPGLVVFDAAITTPCGSFSPENGRTLAFYCPSDQVLYADVPQMRKFFGTNDVAYAIVIGHEFGHHVQEEIGLLTAFDDAVYDDFDNRLELSRRVELQASCMGGLFLGAIAANYPIDETRLRQLDRVSGSFGDEPGADDDNRDHGSGVSNREWIMKGYTDNDLQSCNTFSASSDEVD